MARKLKVFGGRIGGAQRSAIIAAPTKKRAVELLNRYTYISRYEFDRFWHRTHNEADIEKAAAHPEQLIGVTKEISREEREYELLTPIRD